MKTEFHQMILFLAFFIEKKEAVFFKLLSWEFIKYFSIEHYGLDFHSYLNMNIVMVEYPGYFIITSKSYYSNSIFSESLIVYDWIKV